LRALKEQKSGSGKEKGLCYGFDSGRQEAKPVAKKHISTQHQVLKEEVRGYGTSIWGKQGDVRAMAAFARHLGSGRLTEFGRGRRKAV